MNPRIDHPENVSEGCDDAKTENYDEKLQRQKNLSKGNTYWYQCTSMRWMPKTCSSKLYAISCCLSRCQRSE